MSSVRTVALNFCLLALILPYSVIFSQQTDQNPAPDANALRLLERARYRFQNGNLAGALENLNRIAGESPEFSPVDRLLLSCRCHLALGDSAAFDSSYATALAVATARDDFTALLQDIQLLMTTPEADRLQKLSTADERADFFRRFWKSRDPDPISERNERLAEHYTRMRESEQNFSRSVNEYLLPTSRNFSPGFSRNIDATSPIVDYPFPLPSLEQEKPRQIELDQRGILYLRHGPPDKIERQGEGSGRTIEIWHYGNALFRFEGRQGAGNFISVPDGNSGVDMSMAEGIAAERFTQISQDYYAAEFRAPDGRMELEFYQSLPASAARDAAGIESAVAIFDSTWNRIDADFSTARRVFTGRDSLIVAVNRLVVPAGDYFLALRLAVPPKPVVIRSGLKLKKYPVGKLELSGIVFGSPPDALRPVHSRRGVNLLPRPSLAFRIGEIVSVFYEIYGLGTSADGERTFRELVKVSIASGDKEKEEPGFSGSMDTFLRWDANRSTTLTLSFDRAVDQAAGPVAENFDIATEGLVPGIYRLYLDIEDTVTGQRKEVTWYFDLLPDKGAEKP